MKFCKTCHLALRRETSANVVEFRCLFCGRAEPGGPADARISGHSLGQGSVTERYRVLLRNAPHDPVNYKVPWKCPRCPRDYVTVVRIGPAEVVRYVCKCGFHGAYDDMRESEAAAAEAAEAAAEAAEAAPAK
jgi:predicted RNA-binding Zn-ribbon protein involved in translation (DUF1610 family)